MATTATSNKLDTPQALFVHELSDIRSAESIILTMLDEAIAAVSDSKLKDGLTKHREQTQRHLKNVNEVFKLIGAQPESIVCKGAKGLHEEAKDAIKEKPAPAILDSMIASGAMKTENYEIVAYEGLVEQAKSLGQSDAAKLLQDNLKQEKETLKALEALEPALSSKVEKLAN